MFLRFHVYIIILPIESMEIIDYILFIYFYCSVPIFLEVIPYTFPVHVSKSAKNVEKRWDDLTHLKESTKGYVIDADLGIFLLAS